LPLVVEVWSASTGDYDVETKLPIYRQRGDLEIWLIHPYARTITTWRRQPDGTYEEALFSEGALAPMALQGVTIRLDDLFDFAS
jgi:Uma2 family endonuclease